MNIKKNNDVIPKIKFLFFFCTVTISPLEPENVFFALKVPGSYTYLRPVQLSSTLKSVKN